MQDRLPAPPCQTTDAGNRTCTNCVLFVGGWLQTPFQLRRLEALPCQQLASNVVARLPLHRKHLERPSRAQSELPRHRHQVPHAKHWRLQIKHRFGRDHQARLMLVHSRE